MVVNTEWYRVFLYASETSNLTKAAHLLHMTQPSASYIIKQLEEALGVSLFERLPKGVKLTEEGQALYRHVRQAFGELESAEGLMKKYRKLGEGRLRIGANGAIIKDVLLPALDKYHQRYPDIRIQLSQERTDRIAERLKDGSLDAGFVYQPVSDPEIEVLASYAFPYCAVVGRALGDAGKEPLRTERLLELPLLMLTAGSTTRSFIEEWFHAQGMQASADIELNSLEMIAEFAERGFGAAILPRTFVASRLESGTLIELRTEVPLPERQIGVAVRKRSSPSLAAGAFLEMLKDTRAKAEEQPNR